MAEVDVHRASTRTRSERRSDQRVRVERNLATGIRAVRVRDVPDDLAAILDEHLAQQRLSEADTFVFSSPRGGPLNYQNFMLRIWKPAVMNAGLEGVTAHDLRHSAATYLDAVGAPEQLIRRRLGHGSSDITRRVYVHVLDETDRRITRALGELVWRADADEIGTDPRATS
jgi:integrase